MNTKTLTIDLSKERYMEHFFNPLAFHLNDEEFVHESDNKFGWNVFSAEIKMESSTNKLLEYKLISRNKTIQSRGKRISTPEIEYWHFEYLGRKTKYSPDNFLPRLDLLLKFFYCDIIKQDELYTVDSTLPIVAFETSAEKRLISIRYSLSADQEFRKPLFLITIDKDGYLHTISDWQLIDNKHTVFPTPSFNKNYLLQDFSDNDKCPSNNPIEINSQLEKGEIYFGDFKIDFLYNAELEEKMKNYGFFISDLRKIINDTELLLKYIPTINFHILKPCNMNCLHCFSGFNELKTGNLRFEDANRIIEEIGNVRSFRKLNFSGGEPTMYNGIEKLIEKAKEIGIKEISLVTNGYKLLQDSEFFNSIIKYLDILVFSIDSFDKELNHEIGRTVGKKTISFADFYNLSENCQKQGVKIKINTVVTKKNCNQILANEISQLKPIRWKILRMLPIDNQNEKAYDIVPTYDDFKGFIDLNKGIAEKNEIKIITEDNEDMTGSYLMISPDGRFFYNTKGNHNYTDSILDIGIRKALNQAPLMREVFYKREGDYSCN